MYEQALCGKPNVTEYDVSTLWIFFAWETNCVPYINGSQPPGNINYSWMKYQPKYANIKYDRFDLVPNQMGI